MKILSIGNSFSQDAQRYLHALAKHNGTDIKAVNLYIGGCTLRRHYHNMLDDRPEYDFEFNGEKTGIKVSIKQALVSDDWDYVTLQQASGLSPELESYFPYLEQLTQHVKKYCPHTKLLIHQTWAYEDGSEKLQNLERFGSSAEMISAVKETYAKAATLVSADGIIPAGETMAKATELGIVRIHRDTYHASLGVGRYLLALCWYKYLTGKSIENDSFNELDVELTPSDREIAIRAVNSVLQLNR